MTLSASGPIRFSDLQTEYGGTNPISLSEYRASYAYTQLAQVVIYDAGLSQFDISLPNVPGAYSSTLTLLVLNPGMRLKVQLVSANATAFYLSTSTALGATDLMITGVTNNGSSTDGSSIILDTSTYTSPATDGLVYYEFYLKTAAQLICTYRLVNRPAVEEVLYLGNSSTVTWPTILQGGSDLVLAHSGSLVTTTIGSRTFLRPGQSVQFSMDCTSLGSVLAGGTNLATYVALAPTAGDTTYPYSGFGTTLQMGWFSSSGTGSPSFIGGSGLSDTAANVAALCASTCSSARVANVSPVTGMVMSCTAVGTIATWTLTNNTSDVYFIGNYLHNDTTYGPLLVWTDSAGATALSNDATRAATWGIAARNRRSQQWGVPLFSRIQITIGASSLYTIQFVHANNVDQATLISDLKTYTNQNSAVHSSRNVTNGLEFMSQYALSSSFTIGYLNQVAGTYVNLPPGATDTTPTITDGSPSPSGINYNGDVRAFNENLTMSHYYDGEVK